MKNVLCDFLLDVVQFVWWKCIYINCEKKNQRLTKSNNISEEKSSLEKASKMGMKKMKRPKLTKQTWF